ncbi:MAG: nicotinate-nucleotide--dimethylbenzimidazole phosphoribosyltransferase [Granulosicoccaceae bacterium]
MFSINPLDPTRVEAIQQKIDGKTKPPGSLGSLEPLAKQLVQIVGDPIELHAPSLLLFAGDHGVAEQGVSIAPSEVTQLMVQNFLAGGAAINCFSNQLGWELSVIDAGIKTPLAGATEHPNFREQRVGPGTANLAQSAAMSKDQAVQSLQLGATVARETLAAGANVIACGEMGIANSTSAAAIATLLLGCSAREMAGRGTGIDDAQLEKKITAIESGCKRAGSQEPLTILSEVGGFEIGQMAGAMLATAEASAVIVVDGFIATSAALLAARIAPNCRDYMVFAHRSHEQGHRLMLEALEAEALLDLQLRLGEGTGAALALPLLQSAAAFYNNMASLDAAQIDLP